MDRNDNFIKNYFFDFNINRFKERKRLRTITKTLLETGRDIIEGHFTFYPDSKKGCALIVMRPIHSELSDTELAIWENVTEKEAWKLIKTWVREVMDK